MQTFLPCADFFKSARVLDRQRLGKQRVENLQIMKALVTGQGWVNHPATKMWRGYECDLMTYQSAICSEWTWRGYKDTCLNKTFILHDCEWSDEKQPPWLGDEAFHASHRSNLLRKLPEHYSQFGWIEPDDLPYVWPVS
jgi:hypothetical protein